MNSIYIATSLDGFIADKNGEIEFLDTIPIPENTDMGYDDFMSKIDALVMGRTTFEKVLSFGVDWPYQVPVFVLSNSMKTIPDGYKDKIEVVNGSIPDVLDHIHKKGHQNLYIDGGRTIQSFLNENLIDEIIITIIPVLLGEGIPLFGNLSRQIDFKCVKSELYLDAIVQNHFVKK